MKTSLILLLGAGISSLLAVADVVSSNPEGQSASPAAGAGEAQLSQCLVSLIHDVDVPAREAGVLTQIAVREGQEVKAGQLLAQVDDERAVAQRDVIAAQLRQAQVQSENDVDVRYSKAAAKVSEAEVAEAQEANRLASGAVAAAEVRRLQLNSQRAVLSIEQAELDQRLSVLSSDVRAKELTAADLDIRRRGVKAPLAGVVVEVFKAPGEWVQAGEVVLRVVQMDRLRVEGFVSAADLSSSEVAGRAVTVTVSRPGGRLAEFSGKIVFVNPIIEASGNYRVWAEVENRRQAGHWLLQPGMEASMTIHLQSSSPEGNAAAKE